MLPPQPSSNGCCLHLSDTMHKPRVPTPTSIRLVHEFVGFRGLLGDGVDGVLQISRPRRARRWPTRARSPVSAPSILAALLAAPVTAHDPQPEPDQRPEEGGCQRQEPQRPGETPEQKVEADALGVLGMKMSSRPTPVSEAMAPAPSPRAWACGPLLLGPSRMTTSPLVVNSRPSPTLRHRSRRPVPVASSLDRTDSAVLHDAAAVGVIYGAPHLAG
jgi:hypothetical protein